MVLPPNILDFLDKAEIIQQMRLSDVAEQEYKMLCGKSQIKEQHNGKECQTRNEE